MINSHTDAKTKILFPCCDGYCLLGIFSVFVSINHNASALLRKDPGYKALKNVSLFTFLTFSSGLLLCKNSNEQNIPKWDLLRSYEERRNYLICHSLDIFLFPFLFRWAKHIAEKNGYLGHVIRKGLNAYLEGSW